MKGIIYRMGIAALVVGLFAGRAAGDETGGNGEIAPDEKVAVITTVHGKMVLQFWPDVAPNTVENFKKLARDEFYDGTAFHRIIEGFMIQGGDPNSRDPDARNLGTGNPGYTIDAEFSDRRHERGVISMARGPDPDSAGSQFFICHAAAPALDGQYTAFGKLVDGYDVLDRIAEAEVTASPRGEPSQPVERQEVETIRIVEAGEVLELDGTDDSDE